MKVYTDEQYLERQLQTARCPVCGGIGSRMWGTARINGRSIALSYIQCFDCRRKGQMFEDIVAAMDSFEEGECDYPGSVEFERRSRAGNERT